MEMKLRSTSPNIMQHNLVAKRVQHSKNSYSSAISALTGTIYKLWLQT